MQDFAEEVEIMSDSSNYDSERLIPKEKNKKVIDVMKDKLGREIMK